MSFSSILVGVFLASVPWGFLSQYLYVSRYKAGFTSGFQGANDLFQAVLAACGVDTDPVPTPRPNVPRSEA